MTRALAVAMVAGCGSRAPAPAIANAHDGPTEVGLPCSAATAAELSPFESARCEANGTCLPGQPRRAIAACTIAPSSSFDLYQGKQRLTVLEAGRPILSSSSPPDARTVVFDSRLPTWDGVRVGMTGAELERVVPLYTEIACTSDEPGWRGHLRCHLGKASDPECDDPDAAGLLVVFDPGGTVPERAVAGSAARSLVSARRIVAIDLGPSCGDD